MATYTNKLNLIKPEINDLVSPTVFADNFDKIDAAYGGLSSDLATTDSNLEKLNSNLDNHNHDDRYYTESEVNTKLNTKQNVGWTEVGNVTGTSTVNFSSLKSGKSELALIVTHGQVRTQLIIPIPSNTSVLYMPLPGYFFQTTEQFNVSVAITNKTVSLNVVNYNGNVVTSSSTLGVYIR